jgi:hypothetical protein
MTELLNLGDKFTSQELFVMFHIAYEKMYGRNIENVENTIIYWEPHGGSREVTRDYAKWLCDSAVKGFSICLLRNRYANAGSQLRYKRSGWLSESNIMSKVNYRTKKHYDNWNEQIIRFENLKIKSKETLMDICEWLGIQFDDALMNTTQHGENYTWNGVTGFDVKPAYNIYEEYFSEFDRMRICMLASSYQKRNGYPYVSALEFTRIELQEMFVKDFRWELSGDISEKNIITVYKRHCHYMKSLWRERFANVMDIELEEELT